MPLKRSCQSLKESSLKFIAQNVNHLWAKDFLKNNTGASSQFYTYVIGPFDNLRKLRLHITKSLDARS